MTIGERILLSLSRAPDSSDYEQKRSHSSVEKALELLTRVYPNLQSLVSGKRVVDFGCGAGYQSIALVKKYDCKVVGIDTNLRTLERAVRNAEYYGVDSADLSFMQSAPPNLQGAFDIVISQNSFEHFPNPEDALDQMTALLNGEGKVLLTFGPPWLAPYGSHMHFFCKVPWVNILFPEETVMKVRGYFRDDGARRYEDVESGLNKMTVSKFESIVASSGLRIAERRYDCVKGVNWIGRVPLLRELFINHVTATLSRSAQEELRRTG